MFDAIDTSGTGLSVYRTWIDTIANNIANVNDESPTSGPAFQAQFVQAEPIATGPDGVGHGVHATGLPRSSAAGIPTYDPQSPVADQNGYVRRPDIDMSQQMGNLIMAQRAFQANANVVDRAKDVYQAAIAIGKGI
ncbi:MAG: flagellar basal body rod protein FlgG [Pseudonocardiales bacterium]|nr:flagellar basal body rod protein FlgG [Pseudonocardiales bacterium]